MQEGPHTRGEECTHHQASAENAFFCTACGHQLKHVHGGKVACRAAEGSAEVAWKAFGFASAHASGKLEHAGVTMPRTISARRAASQALAATSSIIEKDAALPTSEQAKVMGVESVVEGVTWDLSTEQLQIMALARSGALRNRRRSCSNVPEPSPATTRRTVYTKNNKADNRNSRANKTRGSVVRRASRNRRNLDRHTASAVNIGIAKEHGQVGRGARRSPGQTAANNRHSGYEPSPSVLPEEARHSQNEISCARTPVQKKAQREGGMKETQEQAIAMARGGVRYGRVVFHRKGVKLTQDSPRSMLPRDAFRSSELNQICTTEVSIMGPNGNRWFVVALSVITPPSTPDPAVGGCSIGASPMAGHHGAPHRGLLCSGSLGTTGTHPARQETCGGVRLDVRHVDGPSLALDETDAVASEAAPLSTGAMSFVRADSRESGTATAGRVEQSTAGVHGGSDSAARNAPGNDGSDVQSAPQDHRGAEGDLVRTCSQGRQGAKDRHLHEDTLPESKGPRGVDKECHYDPQDEGCRRRQPVTFSLDLTHSEVDALLGPAMVWKDPFEEEKSTVRELEDGWTACLHSLCGRLHATAAPVRGQRVEPSCLASTDNGHSHVGRGGERESAEIVADCREEPCPVQLGLAGEKALVKRLECPEMAVEVDNKTGEDTLQPLATGSVVAATTIVRPKKSQSPRSADDDDGDYEASRLQAVRHDDLPACSSDKRETQGDLWFDKALLRVGARVPWGRRHRGRFAKVLFTVSLGEGCRGLEFSAVSFSPTGDPMLRGRWNCKATDRDLARYLSPECGTASGVRRRVSPYELNPQRCAFELQQRGELEWACTVLAQKAFRLVLTVPGGVTLKLAGTAVAGGREIAWPQDIELDRVLAEASVELQRACRGWMSRKRTRWVRMEREGRRRLSRLQKEIEAEREMSRVLETQRKVLHERRTLAQVVLATAARRRAAQRLVSRRREEASWKERQRRLDQSAEAAAAAAAASAGHSQDTQEKSVSTEAFCPRGGAAPIVDVNSATADKDDNKADNITASTVVAPATPGVVSLERVVTIDGTEVQLTAQVKGLNDGVDGGVGGGDRSVEMSLVAFDKKTRRSSRLQLGAADIGSIVGAVGDAGSERGGGGGGGGGRGGGRPGALEIFSTVLKSLTVFNSRRKELFILSYRGKKIAAPH